jgi:hypothetical protein
MFTLKNVIEYCIESGIVKAEERTPAGIYLFCVCKQNVFEMRYCMMMVYHALNQRVVMVASTQMYMGGADAYISRKSTLFCTAWPAMCVGGWW